MLKRTHRSEGEAGRKRQLIDTIGNRLVRRHSTAVVLFHHAIAEQLGLGPADHKCLDLLIEHGALTASDLVSMTGLSSGALTGVVARLERAGYLHRAPDPDDGRRQILSPVPGRMQALHAAFAPIRQDLAALLGTFDFHQLAAISAFLEQGTEVIHRHRTQVRAQGLGAVRRQSPHRQGRS